ncbi:MAG TPA: hypothetical protein PLE74_07965 [Candidatus Cloacimonadota bacterium]|nr:hypothetical protein [Candidatus Cloacimonadota bacterium]
MSFELVEFIIALNIALALGLYTVIPMFLKDKSLKRIKSIANECVEIIHHEYETEKHIADKNLITRHEKKVCEILIKARMTFSNFGDQDLIILNLSYLTFSAFISQTIVAFIYKASYPSVVSNFIYTSTFIFALLYLLNACYILLYNQTCLKLGTYITLGDIGDE